MGLIVTKESSLLWLESLLPPCSNLESRSARLRLNRLLEDAEARADTGVDGINGVADADGGLLLMLLLLLLLLPLGRK